VNWLTERLAALESFGPLHEQAEPIRDSTLRRLPFELIVEALAGTDAKLDAGPAADELREGYLYTEAGDAAWQRLSPAAAGEEEPTPHRRLEFTAGLLDSRGPALYLPEDDADTVDLQVFAGLDRQPVYRLHAEGDFAPLAAQLRAVRREPPSRCPDGMCTEGERCGDSDCLCRKFVRRAQRISDRLRAALGPRGSRYDATALACHR
jgi:hypothetical protein